MSQSTTFIVLVAALLTCTFSYCLANNVYCVTPSISSCSSCPPDSVKCTTLSEYAQEAVSYFTSNTTLEFLPGDHVLDKSITLTNIYKLTMHGKSSSGNVATIVCHGEVGLSFTNMVKFKVDSLDFTSCNRKYGIVTDSTYGLAAASTYALLLQSTQYAELFNCSFHDNLGTALVVCNTSVTLAGNSEFTHNHCESNYCFAGAIIALSSNLSFTGTMTFLENNATSFSKHYSAGAIYASDTTVINFDGNSNFIKNSADSPIGSGGAIYASNTTVISFDGNSNFINNSADGPFGSGSAIYASNNTALTFNGTNTFINNSAGGGYGGAFLASGNNVRVCFTGTNSFISNSAPDSGDAICTSGNTVLSFHGTSNFISNSHSGAIYILKNSTLYFSGINNFIDNSAQYSGGGAIFSSDHTRVSFNGRNNFINNSGVGGGGGAMHTSGHAVLSFNGTNNFVNNSADGFGTGFGGAICTIGHSVISFNGTNNFVNNSANDGFGGGGGAICTFHHSVISFNGTSNFIITQQSAVIVSVVQFLEAQIVYLSSMEPVTLSATQLILVVVQSWHQTVL